jgi:hypothetical protein
MVPGSINTLINSSEEEVLKSNLVKGLIEPIRDDFDDCYYLIFEGNGVEFRFSLEGCLKSIYLYGIDEDDCGEFGGALPLSLYFDLERTEVQLLLGDPQYTDAAYEGSTNGQTDNWDLYHFNDYSLNIEYLSSNNRIKMITVMSPDTAPYKHEN